MMHNNEQYHTSMQLFPYYAQHNRLSPNGYSSWSKETKYSAVAVWGTTFEGEMFTVDSPPNTVGMD